MTIIKELYCSNSSYNTSSSKISYRSIIIPLNMPSLNSLCNNSKQILTAQISVEVIHRICLTVSWIKMMKMMTMINSKHPNSNTNKIFNYSSSLSRRWKINKTALTSELLQKRWLIIARICIMLNELTILIKMKQFAMFKVILDSILIYFIKKIIQALSIIIIKCIQTRIKISTWGNNNNNNKDVCKDLNCKVENNWTKIINT